MVSLRLHTLLVLNLAYIRNSPDRSTKSTRSLIAQLPLFVNKGFQVLFHSPPGVLFTFPSQYCSSIGHQGVFRLGGWSPRLQTGFLVSGPTLDSAAYLSLSLTGLSPSAAGFPKTVQLAFDNNIMQSVTPPYSYGGLAFCRFARRYSGNRSVSLSLSFPAAT